MEFIYSKIRDHLYKASFLLSNLLIIGMLLYPKSDAVISPDTNEQIQYLDIDNALQPRSVVKKTVSPDKGEIAERIPPHDNDVSSNNTDAVDLSFNPHISPPRLLSRLAKIYPKSAKSKNIEAQLLVELLISREGFVKRIKVNAIRLSKIFPEEYKKRLFRDFHKAVHKMLKVARFSPPIINGQRVSVIAEYPIYFHLN